MVGNQRRIWDLDHQHMKKLLLAALFVLSTLATQASITLFTISMTGAQDTPPNASLAAGGGIAAFDDAADTISLSVFFAGLSAPATASHIHLGAPGIAGPVLVSFVPFTPAATAGSIVGGPLAFPAGDIPSLLAGDTYFNIHDGAFPEGEIRGQLVPVVVPEPTTLFAGALLLLPFGASALQLLRKAKTT